MHPKIKRIVELGCGHGSTNMLHALCILTQKQFVSLESDEEWAAKFPGTKVVDDYWECWPSRFDMVFIDSKPGEDRGPLTDLYSDAGLIIVHDTQDSADHIYGTKKAFKKFKYRADLVLDELPRTTAVSNFYDISHWSKDLFSNL